MSLLTDTDEPFLSVAAGQLSPNRTPHKRNPAVHIGTLPELPAPTGTQTEVERAVSVLGEVLRPLGTEPTLETRALDKPDFEAAPDESNRIFIAGRPLEDWIGETASASECCSVCGTNQCRAVEVDGEAFETVPTSLIIKAGLRAAREVVEPRDRRLRAAGSSAA